MGANISRQRYLFDAPGTYYIDLFRSLSAQERRLVRQCQVAHVHGGLIKDSNNESVVRMNVAPDTWVTRTAIRRGRRLWMKMIDEALEATDGVIKPKYLDYKVYLNANHDNATVKLPVDANGDTIPSGEWVLSNFHSEDVDWADYATWTTNRQADSFGSMIVGTHVGNPGDWSRIGLIESWIKSRAQNNDYPSGDQTADIQADPLNNLFDEADAADEVMNMMYASNDQAPYDEDTHFGYDATANGLHKGLQRVAFAATQAGAGQISAMNGFSAICGLVEVHITQTTPGQVELILDVATKGGKI